MLGKCHSEEAKKKMRLAKIGKRQSPEIIEKRRRGLIGRPGKSNEDHWKWRGGRTINASGYIRIKRRDSSHYDLEHRLVMEKYIGRRLNIWEDVHHINGNRQDNRIENLQLLSHDKHVILEHNIRKKLKSQSHYR